MSVATFAPTVEYDENGYSLDESSDSWKSLCQNLPCSLSLQWPGYTTTKFEVILNGEPAVIQPWKGICPTPEGFQNCVHAATRYSWMSPPRMSWRSIVFTDV